MGMSEIAGLRPNSSATIEATIVEISPVRNVNTQRGPATVADATLKDDTGTIVFTLWNEATSKYQVGQKIKITDGWVKDFRGKLQIALGRSGTAEVLSGP